MKTRDVRGYRFFRFPRRSRLRGSFRGIFAGELLVGQSLPAHRSYNVHEPLTVFLHVAVDVLPLVEAVGLFIMVAEKVERFSADVGNFDAPFQQTPVVF